VRECESESLFRISCYSPLRLKAKNLTINCIRFTAGEISRFSIFAAVRGGRKSAHYLEGKPNVARSKAGNVGGRIAGILPVVQSDSKPDLKLETFRGPLEERLCFVVRSWSK
jgi:hypothetical protein